MNLKDNVLPSDMAATTTYLLVSGLEDPESIRSHPLFETHDFELRERLEASSDQLDALTFAVKQPIEEAVDFKDEVQQLSADVPEATVVICEVEERFDQVERLELNVFSNGKQGGDIEHGYVFNVGP